MCDFFLGEVEQVVEFVFGEGLVSWEVRESGEYAFVSES